MFSVRAVHFRAGASADVLGSRHPKGVQRHPDLEGTSGFMLDGKCCHMEKVGNSTLDVMLPSNCTHFVFHVIVRLSTASSLRREVRVCLDTRQGPLENNGKRCFVHPDYRLQYLR